MIPFSLIIVQSNSNGLGFHDVSKTEQQVLLQPSSWLNGWVFLAALKASIDLIDSDQETQAEKNAFQRLWDSFTISLAQLRSHSRSSRSSWRGGRQGFSFTAETPEVLGHGGGKTQTWSLAVEPGWQISQFLPPLLDVKPRKKKKKKLPTS